MDLPQSRAVAPVLEFLAESPSTNDALVSRVTGPDADQWPDLSVVVTDNQTAGRGRLGRSWVSPAGRSLAISVLLRPSAVDGVPPAAERLSWVPLMAGLAMTRAVSTVISAGVAIKWPNDVLIDGLKVCGILGELLPDATGVVIGAGLNVALESGDLPTETSTSLTLAGAGERLTTDELADTVLAAYLAELASLYAGLADPGSGADQRLRVAVAERCETLGRSVRVELPSGSVLTGTAAAIDTAGRLIVETNSGISTVAAGDVTHLRY